MRIVLTHVAKLVDHLQGKIVVTSDHGELLGEKNEYYHRPHHYISYLIDVPYLEC
jgi:arylsulfatase A-like enzyme